jgi:hypothetical protein
MDAEAQRLLVAGKGCAFKLVADNSVHQGCFCWSLSSASFIPPQKFGDARDQLGLHERKRLLADQVVTPLAENLLERAARRRQRVHGIAMLAH